MHSYCSTYIYYFISFFSLLSLALSFFSPDQQSSPIPPPSSSTTAVRSTSNSHLNNFLSSIEAGDYLCALSSDATKLVPQQLPDDESSSTNRVYSELLHCVESFLVLESEDGVARDQYRRRHVPRLHSMQHDWVSH